jgi:uncharacterized protein
MRARVAFSGFIGAFLALFCTASIADIDCPGTGIPAISFIQFQSPNLAAPNSPLTIKGKLSLPTGGGKDRARCVNARKQFPAVLILHGSAGVDSRGDFYEEALNDAGIATLQIDMWEARGVIGLANRPAAPILTIPDAFTALAFLSAHPSIERGHIGVLGFSWGGAISLASAEQRYVKLFGGGLTFAAHVANYPVCYGANNPALFPPPFTPATAGTQFLNLTGAPVLIQIGSNDDYDNGTAHCLALAAQVNPTNNNVVQVNEYPNAFHAWDRLMIPVTALDPFANEGSFLKGQSGLLAVRIVPDVEQALESRERVVRFFRQHLKR